MRLSTKGRYGLMAMFQLAQEYGKGPVSLREIAETQKLSNSYLEQLFAVLRKDGLIKSVRGAQGGYLLSDEPGNITVGKILRSLEGDLSPSECTSDNTIDCTKEDDCATKLVLVKIKDSIDEVVDSITLRDMILDMKNVNSNS
ncbi:MAG TPA: Rrf2 family transcriptional regulator [Tissierellaceae bacterium]|nr:Rrf2 family transcriptional regulator [Tissierellaceae bacterium]